MQHTLSLPPIHVSEPEGNPPVFNVVIAYEDFETGKQAKKVYDFLVENMGEPCEFANQMWKFDVLRIPKLREMAVRDGAAADIILLSCHGSDLPAPVKQWIEGWLAAESRPLAIVALFAGPATSEREQTREYLAEVARRGDMEFFAQPGGEPHRGQIPESLPALFPNMGERALSTLAGAVQREDIGSGTAE